MGDYRDSSPSRSPALRRLSSGMKGDMRIVTSEEYRRKMQEDELAGFRVEIAGWLNSLFKLNMTEKSLFSQLQDGLLLLSLTSYIDEKRGCRSPKVVGRTPSKRYSYTSVDNINNFLGWCKAEARIPEHFLFQATDLSLQKNEKAVLVCIMHVARFAALQGVGHVPETARVEANIASAHSAEPSRERSFSSGSERPRSRAPSGTYSLNGVPLQAEYGRGEAAVRRPSTPKIPAKPLLMALLAWSAMPAFILAAFPVSLVSSIFSFFITKLQVLVARTAGPALLPSLHLKTSAFRVLNFGVSELTHAPLAGVLYLAAPVADELAYGIVVGVTYW
eukprot:Colp12_sorted_trinity150504_noHs@4909